MYMDVSKKSSFYLIFMVRVNYSGKDLNGYNKWINLRWRRFFGVEYMFHVC